MRNWKFHTCKLQVVTSDHFTSVTNDSFIFVTGKYWTCDNKIMDGNLKVWHLYFGFISAQKYFSKKKLKDHCELFRATSISDGPLVTIMLTTWSWTIWEFKSFIFEVEFAFKAESWQCKDYMRIWKIHVHQKFPAEEVEWALIST